MENQRSPSPLPQPRPRRHPRCHLQAPIRIPQTKESRGSIERLGKSTHYMARSTLTWIRFITYIVFHYGRTQHIWHEIRTSNVAKLNLQRLTPIGL